MRPSSKKKLDGFQQIQQQDAQRRQQEDARRTQQQFFDQQAAQQRQQQAAWQQPFQSSARTSYAGSVYTGGGSASRSQTAVSSGFSSTSCAPHTSTDRKAFGWVFLLGVFSLIVYSAMNVVSPYLHGQKMDIAGSEFFRAQPTVANGVYTYAGSDVMKFRWIHDKDHPMHLNGRTVVVTGDVSNANIHANGNVTFQGNLRNVNVTDNDWTITANGVENSALTARKIVVTGEAVATTETLTAAPAQPKQKRKRR